MLAFNDILELENIEPTEVAVVLHTPSNRKFRRMLPWLVAEKPELFQTFQSVHSLSVEATLKRHKYMASFVAIENKRMVFAGFFQQNGWQDQSYKTLGLDTNFNELAELEAVHARDIMKERGLNTRCVFDFVKTRKLATYEGRLIIQQPSGRNYVRLAEKLKPDILAIAESSAFVMSAPNWDDILLNCAELRMLPHSWAARLREWRGVYLIVDEADGAQYVGSAYGTENILGRWRAHVSGDKGITKELSKRNPANFRFSILQLLAPDADASDVINIEHSWMNRLHTREFGLNA